MEYNVLGNTGIKVSKLCFGSLTIGPLQGNLQIEEGADIICDAFNLGVNFIDTAEYYDTYLHINRALKKTNKENIVIATKSYAYTYSGMQKSIKKALKQLSVNHIDIFLLHEQESLLTFRGHSDAYKCLEDAKKHGIIKAIGISTHHVEMVRRAVNIPEIEIIHPLINIKGLGIPDGTVNDMLIEVEKAYNNGKGIYGMKPLGGGNLIKSYDSAIDFVLGIPHLSSIALGMKTKEEVIANVMKFKGINIPQSLKSTLAKQTKNVIVEDWCIGCGRCAVKCPQKAIKIIDGKAYINKELCILCGYCSGYCPEFCIKIV